MALVLVASSPPRHRSIRSAPVGPLAFLTTNSSTIKAMVVPQPSARRYS